LPAHNVRARGPQGCRLCVSRSACFDCTPDVAPRARPFWPAARLERPAKGWELGISASRLADYELGDTRPAPIPKLAALAYRQLVAEHGDRLPPAEWLALWREGARLPDRQARDAY
jgi:hypothetical protein